MITSPIPLHAATPGQEPRCAPEDALATPSSFLRWLATQKALERSCIGYSNTPRRCPLATFAHEALGISTPRVCWRRTVARGPLRLVLQNHLGLRPPWARDLVLPLWCERFVQRIDDLQGEFVVSIAPSCALRLLHEVVEYGGAAE